MKSENVVHVDRKAPRPKRSSLARSLYDAVDALGGRAFLQPIMSHLPATDDAQKWSKIEPKYVLQQLSTTVSHGYLVTGNDSSGHAFWKIAPLDYYEKRQAHMLSVRLHGSDKERGGPRRKMGHVEIEVEVLDRKMAAVVFVAGTVFGAAVASLICLLF